jgi:hypothetical protein
MKKLFRLREQMNNRLETITPEEKRNINNAIIKIFSFGGIVIVLLLIKKFV